MEYILEDLAELKNVPEFSKVVIRNINFDYDQITTTNITLYQGKRHESVTFHNCRIKLPFFPYITCNTMLFDDCDIVTCDAAQENIAKHNLTVTPVNLSNLAKIKASKECYQGLRGNLSVIHNELHATTLYIAHEVKRSIGKITYRNCRGNYPVPAHVVNLVDNK